MNARVLLAAGACAFGCLWLVILFRKVVDSDREDTAWEQRPLVEKLGDALSASTEGWGFTREQVDDEDPGAADPALCHCLSCAHRRIKEKTS